MKFYTDQNLKVLTNICKKYIEDKFNYQIENDVELHKLIFDMMSDVENKYKDQSLERKNVAVLNAAKDFYVRKFNLAAKVNMAALNRDREVFGNRPVNINTLVPDADPYIKNTKNQLAPPRDLSAFAEQRDLDLFGPKAKPPAAIQPTKETAEDENAFMRKLKEFENEREKDISGPAAATAPATATPPPSFSTPPATASQSIDEPEVTPQLISSQNRQWNIDKMRYHYTIKNINSIINKVIIPDDGAAYAYLTLKVDDTQCHLLYNKSFGGQYGRRYIVYKPMYKKSAVSGEQLSILKPNGDFYDKTKDGSEVTHVEQISSKLKIVYEDHSLNAVEHDTIIFKSLYNNQQQSNWLTRSEGHVVVQSEPGVLYLDYNGEDQHNIFNTKYIMMNLSLQNVIILC